MSAARKNSLARVFLDTNVFFSGFHTRDGAAGKILELMVDGRITVVLCQQVLDELVRVFKKKLPVMLPALREFLISNPMEVIRDPGADAVAVWKGIVPEEDAVILAAAAAAEPDFFATGDRHFLGNRKAEERSGLIICSPADLLKRLEQRES